MLYWYSFLSCHASPSRSLYRPDDAVQWLPADRQSSALSCHRYRWWHHLPWYRNRQQNLHLRFRVPKRHPLRRTLCAYRTVWLPICRSADRTSYHRHPQAKYPWYPATHVVRFRIVSGRWPLWSSHWSEWQNRIRHKRLWAKKARHWYLPIHLLHSPKLHRCFPDWWRHLSGWTILLPRCRTHRAYALWHWRYRQLQSR